MQIIRQRDTNQHTAATSKGEGAMTDSNNYKIELTEAETQRYRSGDKNGLQSEAEMQANSRLCDVYLIASDGKTLFRAYPQDRRNSQ